MYIQIYTYYFKRRFRDTFGVKAHPTLKESSSAIVRKLDCNGLGSWATQNSFLILTDRAVVFVTLAWQRRRQDV